mgnify:CR=1 FL=1
MPQYMIVYSFTENNEAIHNTSLLWSKEELDNAVSIICGTLHGRVEIYTRCTESNNTFYKYRRAVEYAMKGGA